MIRDFVTIPYGEEVVIILVTAAFFLGLSIGYYLSLKFSEKFFETAFLTIVFLHLTFPFSYRLLAVGIAKFDLNGYWYVALMFFYALIFSSISAVFLLRRITGEAAIQKMSCKFLIINNIRYFIQFKKKYNLSISSFLTAFFSTLIIIVKEFL